MSILWQRVKCPFQEKKKTEKKPSVPFRFGNVYLHLLVSVCINLVTVSCKNAKSMSFSEGVCLQRKDHLIIQM